MQPSQHAAACLPAPPLACLLAQSPIGSQSRSSDRPAAPVNFGLAGLAMSALSRLRRALPLAQRWAQAPGACRGFSDLASGLPGRGRGGGGQSDGPSGAPGSSGSRLVEPAASHSLQDSRYDDAEEGAMVGGMWGGWARRGRAAAVGAPPAAARQV